MIYTKGRVKRVDLSSCLGQGRLGWRGGRGRHGCLLYFPLQLLEDLDEQLSCTKFEEAAVSRKINSGKQPTDGESTWVVPVAPVAGSGIR